MHHRWLNETNKRKVNNEAPNYLNHSTDGYLRVLRFLFARSASIGIGGELLMHRLNAKEQSAKNAKVMEFLLSDDGMKLGHIDASNALKKMGIILSPSRVNVTRKDNNIPWFNCSKIVGKVRYAMHKGIHVDYTYMTEVLNVNEDYAFRVLKKLI